MMVLRPKEPPLPVEDNRSNTRPHPIMDPQTPIQQRPVGAGGSTLAAYNMLREAVLSGALPAGSTLSQVELSARLGVSRTPLREAVRLLQNEGLIESEHNRRVRVAPISIEDV